MRLSRIYRGTVYRPVTHTLLIPSPFQGTLTGPEFSSEQVIEWVDGVLDDLAWKHEPKQS
jgi:transcription-repair coupling factor (superfamily II helicase)